jgi:hypothetical protein
MAVFCVDLGAEVYVERKFGVSPEDGSTADTADRLSFPRKIGAFLVLEFGIIFHSVIIGLNLGVLYPYPYELRVRHKLTPHTRLRS